MKNRLIALLMGTMTGVGVSAQTQVPAYSSLDPATSTTAQKADNAWLMGGNLSSPNGRNVFGTTSNSIYTNNMPIYTVTNGSLRMKLNATYTTGTNQYTVNGYGYGSGTNFINTSGFLLLGHNGTLPNDLTNPEALYHTKGAFSMLHLNGDRASGQHVQEEGFRPWMKVGITFTSNNDLAYIGHRNMGVSDVTDMVIGWSNDPTNNNNALGGDNLVFTFLSGSSTSNNGVYGTEIGRFTPSCASCPVKKGSFGIGSFDPSTSQGPGTPGYIGATLDVDGDARIRTVTQKDNLNQILVRDPNDRGRIYWRDASTFTGTGNFGNACGGASNPLTAHHELPLGGFNFRFADPGALVEGFNQVTVGGNGCAAPFSPGKFNVFSDQKLIVAEHSIGLYVEENNQASNANNQARTSAGYLTVQQHNVTNDGVYAYAGDAITNYGGRFESDQAYANGQPAYNERNYGVVGNARNGAQTIGVEGTAQDAGNPLTDKVMGGNFEALGGNQTCYGVRATSASNGIDTYGGNFEGVGNGSTSYGIYAAAWGSATSRYAGYFNGDVFGTGTGTFIGSDSKLKKNVEEMGSAMEILAKLSPKKYEYKTEDYPQMQLPKGEHYGFIAQELETVLPQAVKNTIHPAQKNNEGETVHEAVDFKAVNYQALIPVLVKGLQEQAEKISQLEERLNACCAASKAPETSEMPAGTVIQTRLQNADEPSLGQNIPNPFETSTRIPVYLPQNTGKAELLFYGNDGRVLQSVQISERGNVQVDVNSEALASGIYSYTLFTDGKPAETRKMIKR